MRTTAKLVLATLVLAGLTLAAARRRADPRVLHHLGRHQDPLHAAGPERLAGGPGARLHRQRRGQLVPQRHRRRAGEEPPRGRDRLPQPRAQRQAAAARARQVGRRDRADGSPEDREGAPARLLDGRLDHRPHPGREARSVSSPPRSAAPASATPTRRGSRRRRRTRRGPIRRRPRRDAGCASAPRWTTA